MVGLCLAFASHSLHHIRDLMHQGPRGPMPQTMFLGLVNLDISRCVLKQIRHSSRCDVQKCYTIYLFVLVKTPFVRRLSFSLNFDACKLCHKKISVVVLK